jgi:hypothetical protein
MRVTPVAVSAFYEGEVAGGREKAGLRRAGSQTLHPFDFGCAGWEESQLATQIETMCHCIGLHVWTLISLLAAFHMPCKMVASGGIMFRKMKILKRFSLCELNTYIDRIGIMTKMIIKKPTGERKSPPMSTNEGTDKTAIHNEIEVNIPKVIRLDFIYYQLLHGYQIGINEICSTYLHAVRQRPTHLQGKNCVSRCNP